EIAVGLKGDLGAVGVPRRPGVICEAGGKLNEAAPIGIDQADVVLTEASVAYKGELAGPGAGPCRSVIVTSGADEPRDEQQNEAGSCRRRPARSSIASTPLSPR